MTDFGTLFNDMIQSLQNNKMSDGYIGDVLRNPNFVVLLKALFDSDKDSDKTAIYFDCLQQGFRVCDLQKAFCILTNGFDDTSILYPQFVADPLDQNISESVISEGVIESEARELESIEYFFLIRFNSEENVYGKESNSIEIRSNLFLVEQIVKAAEKYIGYDISNSNSLNLDDCFDNQIEKLSYKARADINQIERIYKYNDFIICCEDNERLGLLYYFLRKFSENLYWGVLFENCLLQLRSYVTNLDKMFQNVFIEKAVSFSHIVRQCKESEIYSLKDLLEKRPSKLNYEDLNEMNLRIQQMDIAKPKDIFDSWISRLKPRELYVISRRYLGENLLTLEEVGTQCNVSRERIHQIEKKAVLCLRSPNRSNYRGQLINQIKRLSPHKSYITISELEKLGIRRNVAIFLDKITGDIIYDIDYNVCFFSRASKLKLDLCIEELPNEFTKAELREYCVFIAEQTKGAFTKEEIYEHILCKCRQYGEYITKSNKITQKIVMSVLMQKYFPDGIDLYEEDSVQFLREKAAEEFPGFELSGNSRAIRGSLQRFCVLVGRGIWKYDTEQILISDELRDLIIQYIEEYKSPVLPIQAIMDRYAEQLSEIEIYNKYSLNGQLKKILSSDYSVNRDYIFKSDKNSFYDVVEAYIKQSALPVTRRDIQEQFPGITDATISSVISATKVINMNGYFVHLDNLNITNEEISNFKKLVSCELSDGNIHHSNVVFTKIKSSLSGLFGRIGVTHYLQFYYLLHELFPEGYEYNRPFIALLGVKIISGEAQVINLMMQQEECSIATIRQYAKDVGTIIDRYIEFVDRNNDSFIFKNRNCVIATSAVGLDEVNFSGLDEVLSEFMGDKKYRLLSDFYNYRELPDLRCSWNTWVLYSVIKKYSQEFKLAVTSNYLTDAKPILIKWDYNEQEIDYAALAESDLGDSEQLLDTDEDMLDAFDYDDLE